MRWQGQTLGAEDEGALPGMQGRLPGLLRTVTTPEFAGMRFHEVRARSALNAVPAGSAMPFRWTINPYRGCSHSCVYCLSGDTLILMADGRTKPLEQVRVGDRVYGTEVQGRYRRLVTTEVIAHWQTVKEAYRVTLEDGTALLASGDHRFLTGRGWKYVTDSPDRGRQRPHLTLNDELLGVGAFSPTPAVTRDYRRGYLTGMIRGDGSIGTYTYNRRPRRDVHHVFRLALADTAALDRSQMYLARFSITTQHFRFTHAKPGYREMWAIRTRRRDSVDAIRKLITWPIDPNTEWQRGFLKNKAKLRVVSVERTGLAIPMFDITTGTGDFIANGVVSHNCYARGTHSWLELDTGEGFDREIVVKVNVADVLARELARPSWQREHVALGTNTDPYQRAEGRYRLMPGIIDALARSATPFSILTKGTLLRRDLPRLQAASRQVPVGLGVSLAIWDEGLHESLEPGAPTPRGRLDLVRQLRDAGLPCGVFLAPVLPFLTDSTEHLDAALATLAEAGASGVTVLPLHLRPGAREWFFAWLGRERPDLVERYRALYGRSAYVPADYRAWLSARVRPLLRRHGLDRVSGGQTRGVPADEEGDYPAGSMPEVGRVAPAAPAASPGAEDEPGAGQLSLL